MLQAYFSHAPWLQIIVSAVAYFAIGAVWYMPAVFGNAWAAGHKLEKGNDEEMKKTLPKLMAITFVLTFIIAIGTGLLLYVLQAPATCMSGIKAGLLVSGVFCALPMAINYTYTAKSVKLFLIDAGYHVIGITLTGIILSVWK